MKKVYLSFLVFLFAALNLLCVSAKDFEDVKNSDWYAEHVNWAYSNSIMNGVSDTSFQPNGKTSRAMLTTILWRICSQPTVNAKEPFKDLKDDWYKNAIVWAYEYGIVNGTGNDEFSPDASLSREELATILYRFLTCMKYDFPESANLEQFYDSAEISDWAKDAVAWAVADGIITGFDNRLMPQDVTTRAQCATVAARFCEKYKDLLLFEDNPSEDFEYRNIVSADLGLGYRTKLFGAKTINDALYLTYPSTWRFTVDNSIVFTYGNIEVGRIIEGDVNEENWKIVSKKTVTYEDVETLQYIEKSGAGATLKFRYRYVYKRSESPFTAIFDYKWVNRQSAKKLLEESRSESAYTDAQIGALSSLQDTKNILILGNSFVGSSKIGTILKEMFDANNVSIPVRAISRGYANVGTYAKDFNLMQEIYNKYYGAIFICGLYEDAQLENIEILLNACKESDTELIILPAHNEHQKTIDKAREEFPEITILDWKNEIQAFIDTGMSKWDFCINDSHFHSKPLAGYVGAHMIYRAIQGEVPEADISGTVSQKEVENKLGDYIKKGYLRKVNYLD